MSTVAVNQNCALKLPSKFFEVDQEEMEYLDGGGFVGLHIKLAGWIIERGSWLGGSFVAGYVGWYVLQTPLAKAGPWGAGAAATITAIAGGVAGYCISKGLKNFKIGKDIPGVSWSRTVKIG